MLVLQKQMFKTDCKTARKLHLSYNISGSEYTIPIFTCSKSTMEAPEQLVKSVQS